MTTTLFIIVVYFVGVAAGMYFVKDKVYRVIQFINKNHKKRFSKITIMPIFSNFRKGDGSVMLVDTHTYLQLRYKGSALGVVGKVEMDKATYQMWIDRTPVIKVSYKNQ